MGPVGCWPLDWRTRKSSTWRDGGRDVFGGLDLNDKSKRDVLKNVHFYPRSILLSPLTFDRTFEILWMFQIVKVPSLQPWMLRWDFCFGVPLPLTAIACASFSSFQLLFRCKLFVFQSIHWKWEVGQTQQLQSDRCKQSGTANFGWIKSNCHSCEMTLKNFYLCIRFGFFVILSCWHCKRCCPELSRTITLNIHLSLLKLEKKWFGIWQSHLLIATFSTGSSRSIGWVFSESQKSFLSVLK